MQLKQANTLLVVAMVVVALIVVASGYVIFAGLGKSNDALKSRKAGLDNLTTTYENADPFPNEDNIRQMRDNIGIVSNGFETLLADLGEGVALAPVDNSAVFSSRREEVLGKLTADAPVGNSGARIVPEGFMFGFEAYRDGHMATLDLVPRLLLQLDMIDALVREMYASHSLSLSSVEREVFETAAGSGDGEEEESSRRRGRRGGRRDRSEDSDSGGADVDAQGDLRDFPVPLNRQKFHFVFDAKEESLVELLNRLAAMPMYVAVTRLDIEKVGVDVASAEAAPGGSSDHPGRAGRSGRFGGRRGRAEATPEPISTEAPEASPSGRLARLFSGHNLESPVRVQLDVEVYNIHRPAASDEGTDESTED